MNVPIRNLYYLLCYAWDVLEAKGSLRTDKISNDRSENLFASVLTAATRQVMRRGLDRSYLAHEECTARPRGKINFNRTFSTLSHVNGRLWCEFDELTHDNLPNRIVKAALRRLSGSKSLDAELRKETRNLVRALPNVHDEGISLEDFKKVVVHRNNSHYRLLIHISELVFRHSLPEEGVGKWKFRDFQGSDQRMGILFETFVRNFLHREQSAMKVSRKNVHWAAEALESDQDLDWLPQMQTDIFLSCPESTVVIETKYTKNPIQENYGKRSVQSGHLYQLFAYLKNLEAEGPQYAETIGLLLYPTVNENFDLSYEMHGHRLFVRSLNLNQEWPEIHDELLRIVNETVHGSAVLAS